MLRAVLVDDEPNCCESLEWQLKHYCKNVQVVATCLTSDDAVKRIEALKPDLVFMDVELQGVTGFDVLNKISDIDFAVIFVTAYEDYAVRAIRFNAFDYLLKPVQHEELTQAIERMELQAKSKATLSHEMLDYLTELSTKPAKEVRRIALSTAETIQFVDIDDIVVCESESNYTNVTLSNGQKILLSKTLKSIEEILDKSAFFRIHQSYLINIRCVVKFVRNEGVVVMNNGMEVPVGSSKKDDFMKIFQRF